MAQKYASCKHLGNKHFSLKHHVVSWNAIQVDAAGYCTSYGAMTYPVLCMNNANVPLTPSWLGSIFGGVINCSWLLLPGGVGGVQYSSSSSFGCIMTWSSLAKSVPNCNMCLNLNRNSANQIGAFARLPLQKQRVEAFSQ